VCGHLQFAVTLRRNRNGRNLLTHGLTRRGAVHPLYILWRGMIDRCYNPKAKNWPNYGGRGITVCARWRYDFAAFVADMGDRPSKRHTLDRFHDPAGPYEPGNCRWATWKEQTSTRRSAWALGTRTRRTAKGPRGRFISKQDKDDE
jgi:hypothetical protein